MANKKLAQERLAEVSTAMDNLVLVIPGIACVVLQKELKTIRNSLSMVGAEIENHG